MQDNSMTLIYEEIISQRQDETLQMVMIVSFISSKIQELQVGIRIIQVKMTKHIMLIIKNVLNSIMYMFHITIATQSV